MLKVMLIITFSCINESEFALFTKYLVTKSRRVKIRNNKIKEDRTGNDI
jgi:hypothetical protein